jgi:hypothetical protein
VKAKSGLPSGLYVTLPCGTEARPGVFTLTYFTAEANNANLKKTKFLIYPIFNLKSSILNI